MLTKKKTFSQQSWIQLPDELYAFVRRQYPATADFSTQTLLKEYPEVFFCGYWITRSFLAPQKKFLQYNFHDFATLSLGLLAESRQEEFRKHFGYQQEKLSQFYPGSKVSLYSTNDFSSLSDNLGRPETFFFDTLY